MKYFLLLLALGFYQKVSANTSLDNLVETLKQSLSQNENNIKEGLNSIVKHFENTERKIDNISKENKTSLDSTKQEIKSLSEAQAASAKTLDEKATTALVKAEKIENELTTFLEKEEEKRKKETEENPEVALVRTLRSSDSSQLRDYEYSFEAAFPKNDIEDVVKEKIDKFEQFFNKYYDELKERLKEIIDKQQEQEKQHVTQKDNFDKLIQSKMNSLSQEMQEKITAITDNEMKKINESVNNQNDNIAYLNKDMQLHKKNVEKQIEDKIEIILQGVLERSFKNGNIYFPEQETNKIYEEIKNKIEDNLKESIEKIDEAKINAKTNIDEYISKADINSIIEDKVMDSKTVVEILSKNVINELSDIKSEIKRYILEDSMNELELMRKEKEKLSQETENILYNVKNEVESMKKLHEKLHEKLHD